MTNPKAVRGRTSQTLTATVANFQEVTDIRGHSGRHPGGNSHSNFGTVRRGGAWVAAW